MTAEQYDQAVNALATLIVEWMTALRDQDRTTSGHPDYVGWGQQMVPAGGAAAGVPGPVRAVTGPTHGWGFACALSGWIGCARRLAKAPVADDATILIS